MTPLRRCDHLFPVNSGLVALVIAFVGAVVVWWRTSCGAARTTSSGGHCDGGGRSDRAWPLAAIPVAAIPAYLRIATPSAGRLEDEHRHREIIESLNEG
jgi:hypothetical protein